MYKRQSRVQLDLQEKFFAPSCFAGIVQRSLRNSSRIEKAAWKGRLQARLPATRKAKAKGNKDAIRN